MKNRIPNINKSFSNIYSNNFSSQPITNKNFMNKSFSNNFSSYQQLSKGVKSDNNDFKNQVCHNYKGLDGKIYNTEAELNFANNEYIKNIK